MTTLEEFYNKFNEDKRLLRRGGQVEYLTTMKYIHEYLHKDSKIIEIGAGTGRYSVTLANEGYDVTAVELVKSNLGQLKAKKSSVKAYQGNALDLHRFEDESFDVTLLLGPMYHLNDVKDQIQALKEAKRVTKTGGIIIVAYIMNEYAILQYGFIDGNILTNKDNYDEEYHILKTDNMLYKQVRLEDIAYINEQADIKRIKIVAADGPAQYIRPYINKMSDEMFDEFMKYHFATCERMDLMGATCHTIDILQK